MFFFFLILKKKKKTTTKTCYAVSLIHFWKRFCGKSKTIWNAFIRILIDFCWNFFVDMLDRFWFWFFVWFIFVIWKTHTLSMSIICWSKWFFFGIQLYGNKLRNVPGIENCRSLTFVDVSGFCKKKKKNVNFAKNRKNSLILHFEFHRSFCWKMLVT